MAVRHRFTIICDDVRQENTGKLFVIGMYSGSIMIPHVPLVLPSLTFLQFFESDTTGTFSIKMRVEEMGTGRVLVEGMGAMGVPKPGLGTAVLKFTNLQIPAFGTYNFVVKIEGEPDPIVSSFDVAIRPQQPQQPQNFGFRQR